MFPFTPHTIIRLDMFRAFFYGDRRNLALPIVYEGYGSVILSRYFVPLFFGGAVILQIIDRLFRALVIVFPFATGEEIDKHLINGLTAADTCPLEGLRQKLITTAHKNNADDECNGGDCFEGIHGRFGTWKRLTSPT